MATLTSQQVVQAGLNPVLSSAQAGGDKVRPGPTTWLRAYNGGGSAVTVTIDSVRPSNYLTDVNLVVSVPAGGERMIGPLPAERFENPADGLASITYSDATSMSVAAFYI